MSGLNLIRNRVYLLFVAISIFLMHCASSQFPMNEQGVFMAQPSSIQKDAIRLKGKVLSKEKVGDRLSYRIQISEILQSGATFAGVEPELAETIVLYALAETKLKVDSEVIFDALAPMERGEGLLELNMVIE